MAAWKTRAVGRDGMKVECRPCPVDQQFEPVDHDPFAKHRRAKHAREPKLAALGKPRSNPKSAYDRRPCASRMGNSDRREGQPGVAGANRLEMADQRDVERIFDSTK